MKYFAIAFIVILFAGCGSGSSEQVGADESKVWGEASWDELVWE